MNAIDYTEDVLRIPYDGVAFRKHAQTIQNVKDNFLRNEDAQKLGPMLDVLSRGMYMLVKDVYRYGEALLLECDGSLPLHERDIFSIVQDGLGMTAYSFFNFRNGKYENFDEIYSVIANKKLTLDVHVSSNGTVFLLNAFNIINNLKGSEKDKAIEIGDILLRGMYHASESIYNPETDPQYVIGSGSDSDYITDRDEVLPKLVESFK
ncbi:MAG: hypothetical protein KAS90_05775 [Candidatus Aenigmarchaeota archaeon]|nr:hypothetical protein [Candidatus Aenigmarchaeota archaeon]